MRPTVNILKNGEIYATFPVSGFDNLTDALNFASRRFQSGKENRPGVVLTNKDMLFPGFDKKMIEIIDIMTAGNSISYELLDASGNVKMQGNVIEMDFVFQIDSSDNFLEVATMFTEN